METKPNPDYTEVQLIIWEHMSKLLDMIESDSFDRNDRLTKQE